MLDSLDIIVVVIIIAAGSLALVVIMNLTEVNISERIREIATLKVLGFNNHEVYSYIFKEVFLLSLLGMILGLPLGQLELIFVMNIIEMEMVMFSTVVEPMSYILGFIIIMIFTILVILLMRKTLRNVQMVESLKSVE
jgi:putative ABC transport system permease protein